MDTLDCVRTRKSVRKFQKTKLPELVLYSIMDAANHAPCAGGIQSWRFIIVEDKDSKKAIARAALRQDWIADAPAVVLLCSDSKRLEEEYGKRAKELYDIQNCSMAAENLMLAAWNFGVGSTFVGAFSETPLRKRFKIPSDIHIHGIIPLGYPAEVPKGIGRIKIEDLTSFEEWSKKTRKGFEAVASLTHPEKEELRLGEELKKGVKKAVRKIRKKARLK